MANKKEDFEYSNRAKNIAGELKAQAENNLANLNVTTKEQLEESEINKEKFNKRLLTTIGVLSIILILLIIGLISQTVITSNLAEKELNSISQNTGEITAINTEMITFSNQELTTANSEQKALGLNGEITSPATFIFKSEKAKGDIPVLDYYFDFSEQRGRDSFIFNADSIKGMVESGQIELRVHALLGGRAYSMFSAEALAEVFATEPKLAWTSLLGLLKESAHGATLDKPDAVAEVVAASVQKTGSTKVDINSIQNGTFASWLLTVGDDPNLLVGVGLPLIMLDGQELNLSVDQLNDPNAFRTKVLERIK